MFEKISAIFIIFYLISERNASHEWYDRNELERKYPGFGTEWLPMGQDENGYIIGYFKEPVNQRMWSPEPEDAVKFTLFSRKNRKTGIKIDSFNMTNKILDTKKPTKFLIHGWLSSGEAEEPVNLKNAFLDKYDVNVFIVDWNAISKNSFYPIPLSATNPVGQYIATFVTYIIELGVDPKIIHILGHSLGAHVSGFTGRNVKKGKIGQITGLDPARPGFNFGYFSGGRLQKTDADFVDVIHTCAGYLGYSSALGHADFYPNSGSPPQPRCKGLWELAEACSHTASWKYYTESLRSSRIFKAYKCKSWKNFKKQQTNCEKDPVIMGDGVSFTARGDFYLYTDGTVPLARAGIPATNG